MSNLAYYGVQHTQEVFLVDAIPVMRYQGRPFFETATDPTPSAPYYPDVSLQPGDPPSGSYSWFLQTADVANQTSDGLELHALLVGARHDGATITTLGEVIYLGLTDYVAPELRVPMTRPYFTSAGLPGSRYLATPFSSYDNAGWRLWPTTSPGISIPPARLFKSLFDGDPMEGHSISVHTTPAAGATSISLTGLPNPLSLPSPQNLDSQRFSYNYPLYNGLPSVVRLGGDRVRYRISYQSFADQISRATTLAFAVSPAIQPSTVARIAGGNVSVEFLPAGEVPVDTPFDILIQVEELFRYGPSFGSPPVSAGIFFRPSLYYNLREPRSWYSEG